MPKELDDQDILHHREGCVAAIKKAALDAGHSFEWSQEYIDEVEHGYDWEDYADTDEAVADYLLYVKEAGLG